MIIGFTGTREPITPEQSTTLSDLLRQHQPEETHHGDCLGADALFHDICIRHGVQRIVVHPPINSTHRANVEPGKHKNTWVDLLPEKPYLDRNKDIVDMCILLIAVPNSDTEQQRSGTWSTVRYARKCNKELLIVYPDGLVDHEPSIKY